MLSAIVLLVLAITLVSATVSLDQSTYNINKADSSFTFTVNSTSIADETVPLSINNANFILSQSSVVVNSTSSKTITVTYNSSKFDFGDFLTTYTYTLNAGSASSLISFDQTYCLEGNKGKIELDVTDEKITNDKAWKWRPFNQVEITVNVKDKTTEDIAGTIEWCLWDKINKECILNGDQSFDVNEGDNDDFTVQFTVNPSDINFDSKDYEFYVKAYDEDTWDESTQCTDYSESVTLPLNKNEVIVEKDKIVVPEMINAGDTVTIEAPIYNIGSKDQKDVSVQLSSSSLGITSLNQIVGSVNAGKSKKAYFTFQVPDNAVSGKNYELKFDVYDKDEQIYTYEDNSGDDVDSSFSVNFKIAQGSSQVINNTVKATISAELASSAKAGQDVIVNSVITNIGKSTATFDLNALGYSAWADSVKLSDNSVSLKAGESKEVAITFKTKTSSVGTNKFSVEVISGDNLVASQPVSVEIEKAFSFTDLFQFGDNWYLWAIGAFNIILVVVIVIVIIRLVRK